MDEVKHRELVERFLDEMVQRYVKDFDWTVKSAIEFVVQDMKREAERRGMSDAAYVEYAFQRHCEQKLYEVHCSRYAHAEKLEKEGHIKEAVYMYEALLKEGFAGSHWTIRLAKVYRKQRQYDDEVRVLERGTYNLEHCRDNWCAYDRDLTNLQGNILAVQERLGKARVWKAKADARQAKTLRAKAEQ